MLSAFAVRFDVTENLGRGISKIFWILGEIKQGLIIIV